MKDSFYKEFIEHSAIGYALHRIVLDDDGKPVDYQFIDVNREFERMTGLKGDNILNKKVSDVLPGIHDDKFDWIYVYGDIALHGGEREFEQYSEPLNRHYRVKAYSPEKYFFTTIFEDITVMTLLTNASRDFLRLKDEKINYKRITDDLLVISGARYLTFNLLDDNGLDFNTVAVSGMRNNVIKASELLGFHIKGKKWRHDPARAEMIRKSTTTVFNSIRDISTTALPAALVKTLEKTFDLGQVAVVKIMNDEEMLGILIIIMGTGESLKNSNMVEAYAQMVGLAMDRQEARQRQAENEQRYRELVQESGSILLRLDTEGNILFCNEFAEAFFGYEPAELIGRNVVGTIVPQTESSGRDLGEMMEELTRNPELFRSNENENMKANGERVWIRWSNRPVFDDTGKLASILCVGQNISEKKQLEDELRKSEERYRMIAENSSDILWTTNMNLETTYVSPSVERLMGEPVEVHMKRTMEDKFPEESMSKLASLLEEELECEKDPDCDKRRYRTVEVEHYRADGSLVPIEISMSFQRDENGNVTGIHGISRDITERVKAREQLVQSERKYRVLMESSLFPVVVTSIEDNSILYANEFASSFFDVSPDKVIGQSVLSFWNNPGDREGFIAEIRTHGTIFAKEFCLKTSTGKERIVLISAGKIEFEGVSAIISVFSDITERKMLEQEIRSLLDDRELLLKEVHHRIKNDMTTISSLLTMQSMRSDSLEVKSSLDEARDRIILMGDIYNTLYRRDDVQHISLLSFLPGIIESAQTAQTTSIPIDIETKIEDITISSKQSFPVGIIVNELINNCYKYAFTGMKSGRIMVTVSRHANDIMEILVADNGGRIPASVIDGNSHGFGLTLVKAYASQYNGDLDICCDPGTTVKVLMKIEE